LVGSRWATRTSVQVNRLMFFGGDLQAWCIIRGCSENTLGKIGGECRRESNEADAFQPYGRGGLRKLHRSPRSKTGSQGEAVRRAGSESATRPLRGLLVCSGLFGGRLTLVVTSTGFPALRNLKERQGRRRTSPGDVCISRIRGCLFKERRGLLIKSASRRKNGNDLGKKAE